MNKDERIAKFNWLIGIDELFSSSLCLLIYKKYLYLSNYFELSYHKGVLYNGKGPQNKQRMNACGRCAFVLLIHAS